MQHTYVENPFWDEAAAGGGSSGGGGPSCPPHCFTAPPAGAPERQLARWDFSTSERLSLEGPGTVSIVTAPDREWGYSDGLVHAIELTAGTHHLQLTDPSLRSAQGRLLLRVTSTRGGRLLPSRGCRFADHSIATIWTVVISENCDAESGRLSLAIEVPSSSMVKLDFAAWEAPRGDGAYR